MSKQHGDLVSEHQDLDVLRRAGASEQRQPAQHAGVDLVAKKVSQEGAEVR